MSLEANVMEMPVLWEELFSALDDFYFLLSFFGFYFLYLLLVRQGELQ